VAQVVKLRILSLWDVITPVRKNNPAVYAASHVANNIWSFHTKLIIINYLSAKNSRDFLYSLHNSDMLRTVFFTLPARNTVGRFAVFFSCCSYCYTVNCLCAIILPFNDRENKMRRVYLLVVDAINRRPVLFACFGRNMTACIAVAVKLRKIAARYFQANAMTGQENV
jgi:hypothetical protein